HTSTTSYTGTLRYALSPVDAPPTPSSSLFPYTTLFRSTASASILLDQTAPTNGTLTPTAGSTQITLSWAGFTDAGSGLAITTPYDRESTRLNATHSRTTGTDIFLSTAASFIHSGLTNGT